jgi:phage terminase large subunit-like protein
MDLWHESRGDLSDWAYADAIAAGFDLGGRDDLCSYALCARFVLDGSGENPIYRYEAIQRSFIAQDTKRDLTQEPYASFISQGLINKSRHVIQQLRDELIQECENQGILYIAHDPYQAMQLAAELEETGLKPIKMAQNYQQFDEPIREFLACLSEGRFTHTGDPLLTWCASNAVVVKNKADRWMFDKATSKEKIDPIVALLMAFRAVNAAPSTYTGKAFFI